MQLTMLALQHQLAVERQTVARPWLRPADGLCWVWFPGCGRGGTTQPLSPPWKILMKHHVQDVVAMDALVVPTVTFWVFFVLVLLAQERWRVLHCTVVLSMGTSAVMLVALDGHRSTCGLRG
jgi:hypothetical protein